MENLTAAKVKDVFLKHNFFVSDFNFKNHYFLFLFLFMYLNVLILICFENNNRCFFLKNRK